MTRNHDGKETVTRRVQDGERERERERKGARGLERIRFCINVRGTGRDDYPQFPSVDDGMKKAATSRGKKKKKEKKLNGVR